MSRRTPESNAQSRADNRDNAPQTGTAGPHSLLSPPHLLAGRGLAEWSTFAISTVIVLSFFVALLVQALFTGREPASIQVETVTEQVRSEAGRYYLPVRIHNSGDQAVEDVWIDIVWDGGGADAGAAPETARLHIDFLAGHTIDEATVSFPGDPRRGQLRIGGIGYLNP